MTRRLRARRALTVAAAAAMIAGCGGVRGEDPAPDEGGAERYARVVNVEVERVEPRSFTRVVRVSGVALPMRDVVVSAQEEGVVRRIVRDKGRTLQAGQTILHLDDTLLRAQVRIATAEAEYAEEVWDSRRRLYEQDSIGSELSYHEARYAAEQGLGNLAVLRARLARTAVAAPIRGILEERLVEVGSRVSPGAPVARLVQTDTVKIVAGAPERHALALPAGAAASVAFDVLPTEVFEGVITYVGAVVDPDSRTFPIELTLPNPEGHIKPGMVADISVVQEEMTEALVVPQQSLVAMEDGYVVFVAEGTGEFSQAAARTVGVSFSQGNEVVVGSGLSAGDLLVVVGQQGLTDGDRVRVVQGGGE